MNFNNNYSASSNAWEAVYNHSHDYSEHGVCFIELPCAKQLFGYQAIANFVDAATKTTALPFVIERNLEGTNLKKTNSIADSFYVMLGVLRDGAPSQSELSINNQIFANAWQQLGLKRDHFNGNPLSLVDCSSLTEGELINSLILRIREIAKRASTKSKKADRLGESRNRNAQVMRLIARNLQQHPNGLYVARVDVEYTDNTVAVQSANHHVKALIGELEGTFKPSVVSYVWDRSHFDAIGYRHHFFLILKTQTAITSEIRNCWNRITNGQGCSFEFGSYVNHPKSAGCGSLYQQTYELFLTTLQNWIKRSDAIRVRPTRDIEHFGMSKLPTPVKVSMHTYDWRQSSTESLYQPAPSSPFPLTIS